MPVLFHSSASPFSAKVRMAAKHLNLEIAFKAVTTTDEPEELMKANPLGKIPTLALDDGTGLFDSRAIMQEVNRMSGNALYPTNKDKRRMIERLEAAGDGLSDVLVAQIYERRSRPEEIVHQPWLDKQAKKAERTLDWLEHNIKPVRSKLNGGQFAVAAAISYLELRFPDNNWGRGRPKLRRFMSRFAESCAAFETEKSL